MFVADVYLFSGHIEPGSLPAGPGLHDGTIVDEVLVKRVVAGVTAGQPLVVRKHHAVVAHVRLVATLAHPVRAGQLRRCEAAHVECEHVVLRSSHKQLI